MTGNPFSRRAPFSSKLGNEEKDSRVEQGVKFKVKRSPYPSEWEGIKVEERKLNSNSSESESESESERRKVESEKY